MIYLDYQATTPLAPEAVAAMGWDEAAAREVVRVSFGRSTGEADVDRLTALWTAMASRRRAA